ncbi:MAG: radical SAM protein [Spirochaetales bacterium]|nr:radical SAM protein [Spirochaetales bacterium]
MMTEYRHIFGPVPSRRLGYSLGVDLVPFKTCSYDCVYCQLGRTTEKTAARREYVPTAEAIRELEQKLREPGKVDFVTFSGSGEPTLHSGLGELIRAAKRLTDVPVAVLTNGSLLCDADVREALAPADLIIPSLDAGSEELFRYINRPCAGLDFHRVIEGTVEFCRRHRKKVWLEVMLLAGVNVTTKEIRALNSIIKKANPAKVQLNTVTRPPAEPFAERVPPEGMRELADRFDGNVQIISDFDRPPRLGEALAMENEVLALVRRRPCSVNDVAGGLNLRPNEADKHLETLEKNGFIVSLRRDGVVYYAARQAPAPQKQG